MLKIRMTGGGFSSNIMLESDGNGQLAHLSQLQPVTFKRIRKRKGGNCECFTEQVMMKLDHEDCKVCFSDCKDYTFFTMPDNGIENWKWGDSK